MEKSKITIYHNAHCSKSRNALVALQRTGQEIELIEYLKTVPSIEELTAIVQKLNCTPHDLIRVNEKIYMEKFKGKDLSEVEWIKVMYENPVLIQRPIVVKGEHAVIARSSNALEEISKLV